MQVRFASDLTSEQYVSEQAWQNASLPVCPNHPHGGCHLARHGTYVRKRPAGTRIARWYCPESHTTFSLLPDCLAARFPGTLAELEEIVAVAERARSLEHAADVLRRDAVTLPSAVRWLRRRLRPIHRTLVVLVGLLPEVFAGVTPRIDAFRQHLGHNHVLMDCRGHAHLHLALLQRPVGFQPSPALRRRPMASTQQPMGPDPKARPP